MKETDLDLGEALRIVSSFGGRREKQNEEETRTYKVLEEMGYSALSSKQEK